MCATHLLSCHALGQTGPRTFDVQHSLPYLRQINITHAAKQSSFSHGTLWKLARYWRKPVIYWRADAFAVWLCTVWRQTRYAIGSEQRNCEYKCSSYVYVVPT